MLPSCHSQSLSYLILQAWQCHPYLKWFAHGWAIEEFIKSSLKNKCVYAHKKGFFEEYKDFNKGKGSGKQVAWDDGEVDDKEEEKSSDEEEGNGKEKESNNEVIESGHDDQGDGIEPEPESEWQISN